MHFIEIENGAALRTFVIIFQTGDEVTAALKRFAVEHSIAAAKFTAVGGFEEATLGYFVWEHRDFEPIQIDEQVEVLSFIGDIAMDGDEPAVHAHVTVGHRGGRVTGGHLMRGIIRPTLEVMLDELPAHLQKSYDAGSCVMLIDPEKSTRNA